MKDWEMKDSYVSFRKMSMRKVKCGRIGQISNGVGQKMQLKYMGSYLQAHIILIRLLMRNEWLHYECVQNARNPLYLLFFAKALLDPRHTLSPGLIDSKQSCLATPLYELIWLDYQSCVQYPRILLRQSLPSRRCLWIITIG